MGKKLLINRNFFLLFFKLYVWQTECIFGMSSRPSFTICLWVKVSGARMSLYVRLWKVQAIYSFIIYFLCSETPFKQACKLISRAAWVKRYMLITKKLKPHLWLGYASVVIIKWTVLFLVMFLNYYYFFWRGGGVGLGFFRGKQETINRNI